MMQDEDPSMEDATKKLEDDAAKVKEEKTKKVEVLRNKVLVMSKMMKMFKTLREENENIMKIKEQTKEKLRVGLLAEGKEAIEQEVNRTDIFDNARVMDMKNEAMPTSFGSTASAGSSQKQLAPQ